MVYLRASSLRIAAVFVPLSFACGSEDPGQAPTSTTMAASSSGPASSSGNTGAGTGTSAGSTTAAMTTATTNADSTTTTEDSTGPGPIFDVATIPDGPEPPLPATDIDAVLTADNAYAFGYGTDEEMSNYFGGVAATLASQIFSCGSGPEQYIVPAADATAEYLYIVSYADNATTQGVIGQFRRVAEMPDGTPGAVVYTGDDGWEVCATGLDYGSGDPTPPLEVVNEQIALCNGGATDPATTSQGWVDAIGTDLGALAVGETNDTATVGGSQPGNEFPLVCQTLVDPEARWMWFNWDPDNIVWPAQSPFIYPGGAGNPMHDFMIFRLATVAVPPAPAG